MKTNPFLFHLISICAGTLGVWFTIFNRNIPALIFDTASVASAVVAVLKEK